MGKFLEHEKRYLAAFKATSCYFSDTARVDGMYRGHSYPYCLPQECSTKNLVPEIRGDVVRYFDRHEIKWHDALNHRPSNHLCDSQVCCVNFLFPFAHRPDPLKALLLPIYPDIKTMLPIEDGQYVACEWIGRTQLPGGETLQAQKADAWGVVYERRRGGDVRTTGWAAAVRSYRVEVHRSLLLDSTYGCEERGGSTRDLS